eukprot:CAMPEP_0206433444 /NCGR_PEP_ID=MMETSP0324_2-20121206/8533_1 /ASSEMBLY_ACC=CAM_ASM_000836 /TAXON_ID=2866 /ORGANISM="Crypthecodinium cohnii, Strain Seligo" /LENGTH=49 /DNA_ID= /DNA_START= /DNA_END= /DNA_ORIENTATION=
MSVLDTPDSRCLDLQTLLLLFLHVLVWKSSSGYTGRKAAAFDGDESMVV